MNENQFYDPLRPQDYYVKRKENYYEITRQRNNLNEGILQGWFTLMHENKTKLGHFVYTKKKVYQQNGADMFYLVICVRYQFDFFGT